MFTRRAGPPGLGAEVARRPERAFVDEDLRGARAAQASSTTRILHGSGPAGGAPTPARFGTKPRGARNIARLARGRRAKEDRYMRKCFLVLVSALSLAGCISLSSSDPSPPPSTVIVPAR